MNLLFMGLAGSALIIVTMIIRFFAGHKLPRWVFLAFWYAALVRLLVPYSLPSSFSVFTLFDKGLSKPLFSSDVSHLVDDVTEVSEMFSSVSHSVASGDDSAPLASPASVYSQITSLNPVGEKGAEMLQQTTNTATTPPVDVTYESAGSALFPDTEDVFASITQALQATADVWIPVWIIGSVLCVAIFAFAYGRAHRKFRESLPVDDPFVATWISEQRLRRPLQVRHSDRITTPVSYGILKPVILLPKSFNWDDRQALTYVLTHECAHIRHFDSVTKLVIIAAVCLYWFNPLVWAMYVLANRDIEFATDAAVVRQCGTAARSQYALTLISMAEAKSTPTPLCNHFSKNVIEERITAIMTMKKTPWISVAVSAVLLTGTTMAFATTPSEKDVADTPSAPAATLSESEPLLTSEDGSVTYRVIEGEDGKPVVVEVKDAGVLENGEPTLVYSTKTTTETTEPLTQTQLATTDDKEPLWWTADEYEAWLEQEKKDLQECLGYEAWTSSEGWFTWTQDRIDEAIAVYEGVLEQIKAGAKVSKPFTFAVSEEGAVEGTVLLQDLPNDEAVYAEAIETEVVVQDFGEAADAVALESEDATELQFSYIAKTDGDLAADATATEMPAAELQAGEATEASDVTYLFTNTETGETLSADLADDDTAMYFVSADGGIATFDDGEVTVKTHPLAQTDSSLTEEEYRAAQAQSKALEIFGEDDILVFDGESYEVPAYFKKFEPFDLTVEAVDGGYNFYYKSALVDAFVDDRPDGGYFTIGSKTDGGEIDVQAVYDEKGKLVGLEEVDPEAKLTR